MTTQTATSPTLRYVGFWLRSLAMGIDTLLLLIVTAVIARAYYGPQPGLFALPVKSFAFEAIVDYLLPAAFTIGCWTAWASTPGKMLLRARIVDARTGGEPTALQWGLRYVAYLASLLPLGLGFIWAAFDERKQGWHDKIAGTVVVRPDPMHDGIARFGNTDLPATRIEPRA